MTMVNAFNVDSEEEESVELIRPEPHFRPISEVTITREGRGSARMAPSF